jgi:hypothetical protein
MRPPHAYTIERTEGSYPSRVGVLLRAPLGFVSNTVTH